MHLIPFSEDLDVHSELSRTDDIGIVLQWRKREGEGSPEEPHRLTFEMQSRARRPCRDGSGRRHDAEGVVEYSCSIPEMKVNTFLPEECTAEEAKDLVRRAMSIRGEPPFRIVSCNPDLIP